jgi:hypothetical protein
MRSPFAGLLLQHGHVHDFRLARQLGSDDHPPEQPGRALKRLAGPEGSRRRSWRGVAGASRYLFLINSP